MRSWPESGCPEKTFRGSRRGLFRAAGFAALVLTAGLHAEGVSAQGLPGGEIVAVDLDAGANARGALFFQGVPGEGRPSCRSRSRSRGGAQRGHLVPGR
jgi:hypothetical protein